MANSVSAAAVHNSYPMAEWPEPEGSSEPDEVGSDLSPDALMAYCQTRLDSIDSQARTCFDDQNKNASETQQIDAVNDALRLFPAGTTDADACKKLETLFQNAITSIQGTDPSCAELPTLINTYNSIVWSGTGGAAFNHSSDPTDPDFIDVAHHPASPPDPSSKQGDGQLGAPEIQNYMQTLSDCVDNINSKSQLEMVNLQSLMSQRQTAVTLTTNLVQSLGDQENKIADNIGH
ncbi:MAG TPA: hypothetical protein VK762_23485 [Polyangiaceae bacterium]|jgi:hypothetical protein|nr:hypothetical protein [Polyangiaceae bacterium]